LGELFRIQNSLDKAIQEYANALKVNPKFYQAHVVLGTIYESKNDLEKAKNHYREALKISPESPNAANNLAWILVETGGDLNEAMKLAQTALNGELKENEPAVRDTLGWIYYKNGAYTAAIDTLIDCVRRSPKTAVFHYHLGMAYFKNGDKEKAKASLSEAIKLSPSFKGIEEAKQTLAKL
jgi:Tfp pilus assembly protein PilF